VRRVTSIDIDEVAANLARFIDAVENGEVDEIIIVRDGQSVARLVPSSRPTISRRLGVARGAFQVPDSIDAVNGDVDDIFTRDSGSTQ
jgi:antitoxin (DNA-binding transcriptional repressor) of toxin-antitoxin stability system